MVTGYDSGILDDHFPARSAGEKMGVFLYLGGGKYRGAEGAAVFLRIFDLRKLGFSEFLWGQGYRLQPPPL